MSRTTLKVWLSFEIESRSLASFCFTPLYNFIVIDNLLSVFLTLELCKYSCRKVNEETCLFWICTIPPWKGAHLCYFFLNKALNYIFITLRHCTVEMKFSCDNVLQKEIISTEIISVILTFLWMFQISWECFSFFDISW